MRQDNPDFLVGDGAAPGFPLRGRILLQEENVLTAQGDVVLDLVENVPGSDPVRQFKRYQVEIEDWQPTNNLVAPVFQLGVNGAIRAGAADYQLHVSVFPSNTTISADVDDSHENVRMTRDDNTVQAGNLSDEAWDYSVTIVPGVDANTLPRVWWQGAGINDSNRLMGSVGFGVYRGVTSIQFGRADQIRFFFDTNTIARGIFRLYGTE